MPNFDDLNTPDPTFPPLVYEALCMARRLERLPAVSSDPSLSLVKLKEQVDRLADRFRSGGHTAPPPSGDAASLTGFALPLRSLAAKELQRLEALGKWIPNFPADNNRGDAALRTLAQLANSGAGGLPLTLFINGTQVCGFTVSGLNFYDDLAKRIAQGLQDVSTAEKPLAVTPDSVKRGALSHLIQPYMEEEESLLTQLPVFIHLSIQHILSGHVRARWNGHVCRFSIDQIAGFCYGISDTSD